MKLIVVLAATILTACGRQTIDLRPNILGSMAPAISAASYETPPSFDMWIRIKKEGEVWWLDCYLRNISGATITLEGENLPCSSQDRMMVSGVTTSGRVIRAPEPRISTIYSDPQTTTLKPGDLFEGRVDLAMYFDYADLPTEPLIILWAYQAANITPDIPQRLLTGLSVLDRSSK